MCPVAVAVERCNVTDAKSSLRESVICPFDEMDEEEDILGFFFLLRFLRGFGPATACAAVSFRISESSSAICGLLFLLGIIPPFFDQVEP